MNQSHYDTLGVAPDASADDIKKAYRKLVRRYHPDVSSEPDAAAKASAINQAYNILKDPEKRAAYDAELAAPQDAHSAFHAHNPYASHGHDFHFDDLFTRYTREETYTRPIPGDDRYGELTIDIADAYHGSERPLTLDIPVRDTHGHLRAERKTLNVTIPKGIGEGQHIRLRGQGMPGHGGGEAGDLYLEIVFRANEHLHVQNSRDVYQRLDIAPWTAVLGSRLQIDTPAGKLDVAIPENSRPGQQLRLKGKGIPGKTPGDLYLILNITLPHATSDADRDAWQTLADHYAAKG
ncbi:MAG: DnaJ C-terminal domain-containing protein [Cardiobacteriaceae bacterium]|nr:DnaJ C-terminal domain-containing protein [Cardiobacteriaceae bacterium]